MGSGIGACIPPAPARSRGAWGCNGEIRTSCCSPPHHCTGERGKSNTDGELEGSAQTDLPEGVGAAISLPGIAVQGGATHLNRPQPLLYLQMCVMGGAGETAPPIHVPVMRMGYTGATPGIMREPLHKLTALGLHSCTVRGGWNQRRGAGCWLPAGSQPPLGWNRGSGGGKHRGGLSVLLSDPFLQPWSPAGLEGSCAATGGPVQG